MKLSKNAYKMGDASYYAEASAARCLGGNGSRKPEKKNNQMRIDLLQKILNTRAGWNEVVRSGAIGGLSKNDYIR